jgi:hypothetical protein
VVTVQWRFLCRFYREPLTKMFVCIRCNVCSGIGCICKKKNCIICGQTQRLM